MADFGVQIFPTAYAMPMDKLAREVEARGFESLFVCEHTHIPASRKTPWPGGADLPREYYHTLDPFVALTAAALATSVLKVATGVTLVSQRDPIVLAKTVASLDLVSRGRVVLGIGAGWNVEEMVQHGTAYKERWSVLRERVLAMRALWSEEAASFKGEHVRIEPSFSYPKPLQPGGPPILVGASSRWTWERIAEYGDGWLPIYAGPGRAGAAGPPDYSAGVRQLRAAWEARGRDGQPNLTIFGVPPKASVIEDLIQSGFDRLLFSLPSADADTLLPLLDKLAARAHGAHGA